jgi:quinoprotein glucose dehydrogenase
MRWATLLLAARYTTWSDYGGTADSMQYSALKQIDKSNVHSLELAWSYPAAGTSSRFGASPLIAGGMIYLRDADNSLVALDAASGKKIWNHPVEGNPTDRGLNYWESKDRSDRRLIFAANSFLQEINANTGITINTFGNDGRVDLREGLGHDPKTIRNIQSGTPGRVFENLIILGSATGEGYGSARGDIRAYDLLSGKLIWTFHTIRNLVSSDTRRGRRTPGGTAEERTHGARSRLRRSAVSRTFRLVLLPTIFMERTGSVKTCLGM